MIAGEHVDSVNVGSSAAVDLGNGERRCSGEAMTRQPRIGDEPFRNYAFGSYRSSARRTGHPRSTALVGEADATVPNVEQKPSMVDAALYGGLDRVPADSPPPLHRLPIGVFIETPAYEEGKTVLRARLLH
jgi:hypothetical protein